MQHLETDVSAPSASPARIAETVSLLQSDTVDAPRNLSSALLTRLQEIADVHAGTVPLHGRLFAQWMHHAYPRECPFPHVSGTTSPMSPYDETLAKIKAMRQKLIEPRGEEPRGTIEDNLVSQIPGERRSPKLASSGVRADGAKFW